MATKIDYAQLTEDLKMARALAEAVSKVTSDGGTCNLDSLNLLMGYNRSEGGPVIKRMSKKLSKAFTDAGCDLETMSYGKSSRTIYLRLRLGQAENRSRSIKIARDYLQYKGWPVSMEYRMD